MHSTGNDYCWAHSTGATRLALPFMFGDCTCLAQPANEYLASSRRSDFLLEVQAFTRSLCASSLVADKQFGLRMLRMTQLLCEGHNSWCRALIAVVYTLVCGLCFCAHFAHLTGEP